MLRLVLVPGFVALMLADGGYDPAWRAWAWAAFAVAMITDIFDGHLARTYNLVTDFGKIADPIADKAIMGAALICLSALGDLPWWVTGVILGRELGITLLRFIVIRYGVIPASRGGKLKTLTQGMAVGMYVLALTGSAGHSEVVGDGRGGRPDRGDRARLCETGHCAAPAAESPSARPRRRRAER